MEIFRDEIIKTWKNGNIFVDLGILLSKSNIPSEKQADLLDVLLKRKREENIQ